MRMIVFGVTCVFITLGDVGKAEIKVMSFNIRMDVKSDGENW